MTGPAKEAAVKVLDFVEARGISMLIVLMIMWMGFQYWQLSLTQWKNDYETARKGFEYRLQGKLTPLFYVSDSVIVVDLTLSKSPTKE